MTTEGIYLSESTTYSSMFSDEIITSDNWESTTIQSFEASTSEISNYYVIFSAFNILEIIMTTLELILWSGAAIKMPRWRNNYRNQMLMQLSVVRFLKRIIFAVRFYVIDANHDEQDKITSGAGGWKHLSLFLNSAHLYVDFVIVILVFFFIKHMYDTLIIVLVKCRQNSLNKVSVCAWLLPLPLTAVCSAIIICDALDEKLMYLIICCVFRWPLIFTGTLIYITILIRVLTDKIRKFARSLTVVTFFMCLVTNIYLFSKDVIELWCFESQNTTLISYVSGFIMNFLILSLYIILITLDCQHNPNPRNLHAFTTDHSLADTDNLKI